MNIYFNPSQPAEPFQFIGFKVYCEWINFTRGAYSDSLWLWDSYRFALFREWINLTRGTWNAK